MTFRNYRDREIIFSQGDSADSVFYIESGTIKLTVVTGRRKAIIAILQRGSFFGEGCLAGQSLRICTARSIGESNVIRLQKESTIHTLKRDPKFATLFSGYLLSRVVRIEEDLIDQFFNFSERRLARVLLLFGEIIKESKSRSPLKLSQSTLAEMVGTTRPRVSRFMNDFRKKGLVNYNGGLKINSAQIIAFLQERPMSVKKK
jgi:CRP/FNR family cyclic AMP-dependent transcriptional regulator